MRVCKCVRPEVCVRATGAIASGFSQQQQRQQNKFKAHKKQQTGKYELVTIDQTSRYPLAVFHLMDNRGVL